MGTLTEIWNFITDNKTASIITLLSFILAIIAFFKKPKIVKEIIKETTKVIKKTKRAFSPTAEDCFNYGLKAEKQNNIKKAIKCYKKAIELKPDFAEACKNLGFIFSNETKYDEAIIYFKKLIVLNQYEDIVFHLGKAYYYLNKYDEAIIYLNKAIDFYHKTIKNYQKQMVGTDNENQKDIENYIKELKYCLARAYYYKGLLCFDNKDFNNALLCFQDAVRNDENYAEAHYEIGYLHCTEIPDFDKSEESFQKVLKCGNYKKANTNVHLGLLYYDDKYWFEDGIKNKNIKKKILEKFREKAELKHDKEKAIQHYEEAIKLNKTDAEAYERLGNLYVNENDKDKNKTISLLKKAIDLEYNYAYSTLGKAYSLYAKSKEDYENALINFNLYIEKEYDNLQDYNDIYYNIGIVHYEMGLYYSNIHYDEAIMYFQKAIDKKEKKYAEAYYYMGLAFVNKSLLGSKDSKIGVKHIQRAAELGFSQAQDFLNDSENKKLISNAETTEVEQEIIFTLF